MKFSRCFSTKLSAHLGALALFALTNASAQTYVLTEISTPPGEQNISPGAINNLGQLAATSEHFAFRYTNGLWENLGTLAGGNVSTAKAINDAGDVVGSSQFTDGGSIRHATLFRNGTRTDLGFSPIYGNYSFATSINNVGQVVGYSAHSSSSTTTQGFIWDAVNGMRDIDVLTASSINDFGAITGTMRAANTANARHAYIWDPAALGPQDIGTLAGDFSSGAVINASGHVVGTSTINDFDNRNHAFFYDGTMHDLGSLGPDDFYSDRSSGLGVNKHDVIVGSSYRPYEGGGLYQVAFVYRDATMFDLEQQVDASGADYRIYSGTSINDAGQIVVNAIKISTNEIKVAVLTPITAGSRKVHGAAGAGDISLPFYGNTGLESRATSAAGDYQLVVNFPVAIGEAAASVTAGIGSVSNVTRGPSQLTINLTGVANAQKITVTVDGTKASGEPLHAVVPMRVLAGDVNGDGRVNVGDTNQVKQHSGELTNAENARFDVNLDGRINIGDVNFVKAHSGTSVAQAPQKVTREAR